MKGSRMNRPGPDGTQRMNYISDERDGRILPNVRWRSEDGLIHQANSSSNHTLCELRRSWTESLYEVIVEATPDRVTCVECIGYVTWLSFPAD